VLYEYLDLCVDWDRLVLPQDVQVESESEGGETTDTIIPTPDDTDHVSGRDGADNAQAAQQQSANGDQKLELRHEALRDAVALLVASAVRSKNSEAVKKDVDAERAGIAMWRIR
jgi:hypothetical protein